MVSFVARSVRTGVGVRGIGFSSLAAQSRFAEVLREPGGLLPLLT
jgi:hypothetical protein